MKYNNRIWEYKYKNKNISYTEIYNTEKNIENNTDNINSNESNMITIFKNNDIIKLYNGIEIPTNNQIKNFYESCEFLANNYNNNLMLYLKMMVELQDI